MTICAISVKSSRLNVQQGGGVSINKKVRFGVVFIILGLGVGQAFADTTGAAGTTGTTEMTTSPSDSSKPSSNSVPGSDSVDDLITNNNLRAYSGSTSRWSIASQFNYNGGTVSDPFSQDRPNIADQSGTTTKSDLDGSISAKFNINPTNSVLAGIGVRWIAPLTPGGPNNYPGTRFDAVNPYVTYQYIYKWLGIQSVLQASFTQWTQADMTALGYGQQFNIDQENMYEIGKTNISVGASTQIQYQLFNKSGSSGTPGADDYVADVTTQQSQWLFTFAPELEYQLSEKVNLRTLVLLWQYEHYVSDANFFNLDHDAVTQSVGVGYSVTRDIFLYPNVQFLPADFQISQTNIGLQATINLF